MKEGGIIFLKFRTTLVMSSLTGWLDILSTNTEKYELGLIRFMQLRKNTSKKSNGNLRSVNAMCLAQPHKIYIYITNV